MNVSEQSVVAATKDQVSCSLGAEAAILNTKQGVYYGLDPVGADLAIAPDSLQGSGYTGDFGSRIRR